VGFQDVTQDREFAWRGGKKTAEEVIDLGGIGREEREASLEVFPSLIVGTLYQTH
jgi:hypothetical protein